MASDAPSLDPRVLLLRERAVLVNELKELGFGEAGRLEYDSNFADSSQVTTERSEAGTLAASLQEALDEVENALTKLEAGTYGVCEGCGQPINPARLEAMPAARLCIACASPKRSATKL